MYGHNYSDGFPGSASFPGYNFPPLLDQMTGEASIMAMPHLNIQASIGEYESSSSLMQNAIGGINVGGGGCSSSSYGGSPTSCDQSRSTNFMQRSLSLHQINQGSQTPAHPPHFIWSNINTVDFLDYTSSDGTTPVRRACSTPDLQGINMLQNYRRSESPSMSNEESCSSIIEGMSKACRYSPEEKRERIDKYRSKRNQRNFNKTIKYACRKTLADSRPRIRGRFARNDEIEKMAVYNHQYHHHQPGNNEYQEDEEGDELEENWTHFLEPFSANLIP